MASPGDCRPPGAILEGVRATTLPADDLRDPAVGPELRRILEGQDLDDVDYDRVVRLVRDSSAISAAEHHAHDYAQRAATELDHFDSSPAREALLRACHYVVERRF